MSSFSLLRRSLEYITPLEVLSVLRSDEKTKQSLCLDYAFVFN